MPFGFAKKSWPISSSINPGSVVLADLGLAAFDCDREDFVAGGVATLSSLKERRYLRGSSINVHFGAVCHQDSSFGHSPPVVPNVIEAVLRHHRWGKRHLECSQKLCPR